MLLALIFALGSVTGGWLIDDVEAIVRIPALRIIFLGKVPTRPSEENRTRNFFLNFGNSIVASFHYRNDEVGYRRLL
jgi:hypothetical protein